MPRGVAWKRLGAAAGLGVLSHILLDWITSWGTMFFAPLSWERYSLDWVFIIDLIFTGLLFAGLLVTRVLSRKGDARGRQAARLSIAAASLYIGFCALRHYEAIALLPRVLPGPARERAAIPQPLSPDRWLLLSDDGRSISMAFVDVMKRGRDPWPRVSNEVLEKLDLSRTASSRTSLLPHLYRSSKNLLPRRAEVRRNARRHARERRDRHLRTLRALPLAREEKKDGATMASSATRASGTSARSTIHTSSAMTRRAS